eukprot:4751760-Pleurochrysis_carterae.AAC.3
MSFFEKMPTEYGGRCTQCDKSSASKEESRGLLCTELMLIGISHQGEEELKQHFIPHRSSWIVGWRQAERIAQHFQRLCLIRRSLKLHQVFRRKVSPQQARWPHLRHRAWRGGNASVPPLARCAPPAYSTLEVRRPRRGRDEALRGAAS